MKTLYAWIAGVIVCGLAGAAMGQRDDAAFAEWLAKDQAEFQQYQAEVTAAYQKFYEEEMKAYQEFLRQAGMRWGRDNVWQPERKVWVQYREDFFERSNVQFEEGECRVQLLYDEGVDVKSDVVRRELGDAVQYLVLSGTEDPIQMTRRMMQEGAVGTSVDGATLTAERPAPAPGATYTVKRGDTMWGVAKRLGVSRTDLAKANNLDPNGWLAEGQALVVPGAAPGAVNVTPADDRGGTGGGTTRQMPNSKDPLLLGQVKMPNGVTVTRENAGEFGRSVAATATPRVETVTGSDGKRRQAVTVGFNLVPEHVAVRARKYSPHIDRYAKEHDLIPALVYALMQTESAFNPRARSGAPAYGLMQLVPRSGARDAYLSAYGQDKLLDPDYLYDPEKNIELGTELLKILDTRYLRAIKDPFSRMYCSIAAYNTGAGNVSRAFIDGTSVTRAAAEINAMSSEQVYAKLCRDLPYEETRNYVRRVRGRMPQYAGW